MQDPSPAAGPTRDCVTEILFRPSETAEQDTEADCADQHAPDSYAQQYDLGNIGYPPMRVYNNQSETKGQAVRNDRGEDGVECEACSSCTRDGLVRVG